MKKWMLFLLFLSHGFAQAQSTIQDGFVVLRASASTNVFYDCDFPTSNPDFSNSVTYIYAGENLFIGGEVKTPRGLCDAGEAAADLVALYYSVDGGTTNALNLPRIVAGSIDQWQEASATGMVEIGHNLPDGIHTIEVYFVSVDINFCHGGGLQARLPASGVFRGKIEVRAGPADIRACDDAGQSAYNNGWTNGANGGHGFGPWSNLISAVDGAAGFFVATNPPNTDLNFVTVRGRAWAMYANEGGGGGDDLQIAGAYRQINSPLQVGESFSVDFENGGIQGGPLSGTGGWVGFSLRSQMPPLQFDPDPFSAFGSLHNAQLAVGFHGGDATYSVYDVMTPSGRSTGLNYTTNGVRAVVTLTGADTFELSLKSLGPDGSNVVVTGQTAGGSLGVIGVYDRNAEANDTFFNKLLVLGPTVTNRIARDNAADPAYAGGWATNSNGGFGFNPWSIATFAGAGSAGTFLATNPPNTDLNAIASQGRAWGMYANDIPSGGAQNVTLHRYFAQTNLLAGQHFGMTMEHGGIASLNGSVALTILSAPTIPNPQGEVFAFGFQGGESSYFINGFDGVSHPGIPFTDGGVRIDFKLLTTNTPCHYALTIETRGPNGDTYRFCGRIQNPPIAMRFRIIDVEQNDVFINHLYISPAGISGPDSDNDGMPDAWELENGLNVGVNDAATDSDNDELSNIEEYIAGTQPTNGASFFSVSGFGGGSSAAAVGSVTGRLYTLERTTNLLANGWSSVTNQVDVIGTGSFLSLTNGNDPNQIQLFHRVRVRLAP